MYMHIEVVLVIFSRQENNYGQNYGILDLDDFQAKFQYEVVRLCNQLLSGFSSIHFETLSTY